MKQIQTFISAVLFFSLFIACSHDDENDGNVSSIDSLEINDTLQNMLVRPYSYDLTKDGATITYMVNTKKVSSLEAFYGAIPSEQNRIEVKQEDSIAKIELHDLKSLEYYTINMTAYSSSGEYHTNYFTFLFDYEVMKVTCFKQPFIVWNSIMDNAMQAIKDAGNILIEETIKDNEYHISYLFNYKELKTVYVFTNDKRLKNVLIYLDKERVSISELKRFVSGAFGYLAYGNIHANIDNNPMIAPLYKTPDGSSYVTIYEQGNNYIVDYMDIKDVDITEILYR